MTGAAPGPARLARLLDGYLSTHLLHLAARLGVADALAVRRVVPTASPTGPGIVEAVPAG